MSVNDSPIGPIDCTAEAIVAVVYNYGEGPQYTTEQVRDIADAIILFAPMANLRPSFVAGQMCEETGAFHFGGDVLPGQFNFGGIGTTGGGVRGLSFPNINSGVRAMIAHECAYIYGAVINWPLEARNFINDNSRTRYVISGQNAGTVKKISDFGNGKWAMANHGAYANSIVTWANRIIELSKNNTIVQKPKEKRMVRVALAAGHHNTDSGNQTEIQIVGPITKAYATALRNLGADVRVVTPDDGMGFYDGGLQDVAAEVVRYAEEDGWEADLFLEVHTQGGGGSGAFGIYPDWGSDKDIDAITLIPQLVQAGCRATGLNIWSNGLMSEMQTGVGGQGYRLGIFLVTEEINDFCTRMIIEHGAHDKNDFSIISQPEFGTKWANACAPLIIKYFDGDIVTPNQDLTFPDCPFVVKLGFKDFYLSYGSVAMGLFGKPITNEYVENGLTVQYFERARFEWHPNSGGFPKNAQDVVLGLIGNELLALRQAKH